MLFINSLVIVSSILNIISKSVSSYETLMAGRFLSGLYGGLFIGVLPMYLNELPPKNLRGLVGTLTQLFVVLGILVSNILGLPELLGTFDLWPVLIGFPLIPILAHVGLFFFPESPKYLYINKNQPAESKNSRINRF
jgi:MFS family permease